MQLRGLATRTHDYRNTNMRGMDTLATDEAGSATDAAADVFSALRSIGLADAGARRKSEQLADALRKAQNASEQVHYATETLESVMSDINALVKNATGETIF